MVNIEKRNRMINFLTINCLITGFFRTRYKNYPKNLILRQRSDSR